MYLDRAVTVTQLFFFLGGGQQCIWERVLGQLEFSWERTLEPWKKKHKTV